MKPIWFGLRIIWRTLIVEVGLAQICTEHVQAELKGAVYILTVKAA